ncbi:MAG: hypothetical protein WB930_21350 [Syntrophobacteraceae bacterium]
MMVERISSYLQEDPSEVAIRFCEAIADYVEFRNRDLHEGS